MQESPEQVRQLPQERIRPSPFQPRRTFDPEALAQLAESIRLHGVLQPLTVRPGAEPETWELIAGERRLRAARLAGFSTVPCLVRPVDDREAALLALVENLQRRDLHFLEEAEALEACLRSGELTREELAEKLGRSPPAIANKLRLLRLDDSCRELLLSSGLSERHARCVLSLEDPAARLEALRHFRDRGLTVAQAEQYVERRLEALRPPPRRRTFILKDVRLFLNSLDRGFRLVREAGLDADCQRRDTEDEILLTIRLPKRRSS